MLQYSDVYSDCMDDPFKQIFLPLVYWWIRLYVIRDIMLYILCANICELMFKYILVYFKQIGF